VSGTTTVGERAAIYARMSTDKQSESSPADQIAECRRFAERRGLRVVDSLVMVDAGISGASRHDRPGLLSIMERIAQWDVLLAYDASRLARDEEDFGWVLNQLDEHGRTGFEASTGQELRLAWTAGRRDAAAAAPGSPPRTRRAWGGRPEPRRSSRPSRTSPAPPALRSASR